MNSNTQQEQSQYWCLALDNQSGFICFDVTQVSRFNYLSGVKTNKTAEITVYLKNGDTITCDGCAAKTLAHHLRLYLCKGLNEFIEPLSEEELIKFNHRL